MEIASERVSRESDSRGGGIAIRLYRHPDPAEAQLVLLCIHGGAFIAGDETYNSAQSEMLVQESKGRLIVVQVGFDTSSPEHALKDIGIVYAHLRAVYQHLPLAMMGCSSGAFFARAFASNTKGVLCCVYVCPVFDPAHRHCLFENDESKEAIVAKQLQHFGCVSKMRYAVKSYITERNRSTSVDHPSLIITASSDGNVPRQMNEMVQQNHIVPLAEWVEMEGTHALCHRADERVVGRVVEYVLEKQQQSLE